MKKTPEGAPVICGKKSPLPARFDLTNILLRSGPANNTLDVLGVRHAAHLLIVLFAAAATVDFHRRAEVRT
jgi:hypothetical protein